MKKSLLMSFVLLCQSVVYADSFVVHPSTSVLDKIELNKLTSAVDTPAPNDKKYKLLDQANIMASESGSKIKVNALKYYLGISDDRWIPFYIYTTNSTSTERKLDKTVDSLLDPEGGTLNIRIGVDKKLSYKGIFHFKSPQEGFFVTSNGGVKLVDGASELVTDSKMIPVAYINGGVKLQLPLGDQPLSSTNRVGGLKIGLEATLNHAFGNQYSAIFATKPNKTFSNLDGVLSFWLTNNIYLTAGGALASSERQVDNRAFISLSLSQ